MLGSLIEMGPAAVTVSLPRGHQPLHIMPTSAGYDVRSGGGYDWNGIKRGSSQFSVLQHTISGEGNLRYENRTFRLRPGETLLLTIPHNHRYWLEEGGRWGFFWICMHGDEALRIQQRLLSVAGPVFRLQSATIDRLADCAFRLINGGAMQAGLASSIAYEAIMALYDDLLKTLVNAEDQHHDALRGVIRYINANLQRDLSVNELAQVAGLSRAHFSREFALAEGLPPAQFVLHTRIQRAVKLLISNPAAPVKEIAGLCGFYDANYFAKVFRRYYGASPTELRTNGMYSSL